MGNSQTNAKTVPPPSSAALPPTAPSKTADHASRPPRAPRPSFLAPAGFLVSSSQRKPQCILFPGLPLDVQRYVFHYLEDQKATILSIRRVCRAWYEFARRHLRKFCYDCTPPRPAHRHLWSIIFSFSSLEHLELGGMLEQKDVEYLCHLVKLRRLSIGSRSNRLLNAVCQSLTALVALDIMDGDRCGDAGTIELPPAVRSVYVDISLFISLGKCTALRSVLGVDSIELCNVTRLEVLETFGNDVPPDQYPLPERLQLADLLFLDFDPGLNLESLRRLCAATRLEALHIGYWVVNDDVEATTGALNTLFAYATNLQALALPQLPDDHPEADNPILSWSNKTWRVICSTLTKLEALTVSSWPLTIDTLECLTQLRSLRVLQVVHGASLYPNIALYFHVPLHGKKVHGLPLWAAADLSEAFFAFLLRLDVLYLATNHEAPCFSDRRSLLKGLGAQLTLRLPTYLRDVPETDREDESDGTYEPTSAELLRVADFKRGFQLLLRNQRSFGPPPRHTHICL